MDSFQKPSRKSALATTPDSSFSLFKNLLGRFYHQPEPLLLAVLAWNCGLSPGGAGEHSPCSLCLMSASQIQIWDTMPTSPSVSFLLY